jgi:hypothetical protein
MRQATGHTIQANTNYLKLAALGLKQIKIELKDSIK